MWPYRGRGKKLRRVVLASELLPKRRCHRCTAAQKKSWGCEKDVHPAQAVKLDGEVMLRCPVRPFLDDPEGFNAVMERYRWYRAGLLPEPGTWMDQPNKLLELFSVIDQALEDARAEKQAKQEKHAKNPPPPSAKPQANKYPKHRAGRGRRRR